MVFLTKEILRLSLRLMHLWFTGMTLKFINCAQNQRCIDPANVSSTKILKQALDNHKRFLYLVASGHLATLLKRLRHRGQCQMPAFCSEMDTLYTEMVTLNSEMDMVF